METTTKKSHEVLPPADKQTVTVREEQPSSLLSVIREVVLNPAVNVDNMRALLDMQERLEARDAERAFNQAFSELQKDMPRIKKSGKVEYLENPKGPKDGPKTEAFKFARYEDIDKAVRPLLIKHGFAMSFTTEPRTGDGGGLTMVGTLSHIMGHKREGRIAVALDNSGGKNNIQGMGSSSSYGKRYVLCALLNIITEGEDDDGASAELISIEEAAAFDKRVRAVGDDYHKYFLRFMGIDSINQLTKKSLTKVEKVIAREEAKAKKGTK